MEILLVAGTLFVVAVVGIRIVEKRRARARPKQLAWECPNCGGDAGPGDHYCPNCGADLLPW
jgi:hypothetical protein